MPEAIRTDNGAPFAPTSRGGLSKLSVWFIKLGIKPERIEPGHPEQNGRHERPDNIGIKEATANPPQGNLEEQEEAFDEFASEYNGERPHEAWDMKTPASLYQPSLRAYPAKVPEIAYHDDFIVRRVRHNGEIRWNGEFIYVSEALVEEPVALKQKVEHLWEIRFSSYPLGVPMQSGLTMKITPILGKEGREVLPMCPV